MTSPPPDQSRDRRIEDLTNLWIVYPAARLLLPRFIAWRISANIVSVCGLLIGTVAAVAYGYWEYWPFAVAGLVLSFCWLICDGLDGMIARATDTASPLGRALDGMCDHTVFILTYFMLAWSIDTPESWILAAVAGAAHAVQSSLYEGERGRFHRRCKGEAASPVFVSQNPLVRGYDYVAGTLDRFTLRFEDALRSQGDRTAFAEAYSQAAVGPMRLMSLLSANIRLCVIFLACLAGDPRLFWWFVLVPQTAILIIGLFWHRAVEADLIRNQDHHAVKGT